MTPAHAAITVALIVDLVYGFLVYINNARRGVNQQFLTLSLVLAAWLLCVLSALLSTTEAAAGFWIAQCFAVSGFVPLCFNLLRLSILHPQDSWWRTLKRSVWILAGTVATAVLSQGNAMVTSVVIPPPSAPGGSIANPSYGWAFAIWNAWFISVVVYLAVRFALDLRQSRGMQRLDLQFVLLACVASFLTALIFVVFIPVATGSSAVAPLGPLGVIVLDAIMAYGIVTRRIMGVASILRRATAYTLLTAYLAVLYFAIVFVMRVVLAVFSIPPGEWPNLLGALGVAFSLAPANGLMQRIATRLFVREDPMDVGRMIDQAGRVLQTITTMDELLPRFSEVVARNMGTDRIALLIANGGALRHAYAEPADRPAPDMQFDHPLARSLAAGDQTLMVDLILRRKAEPILTDAARALHKWGFAAAAGIRFKGGLTGVMLLGPRLSGRVYGAQEQDALRLLCGQLAVALDNSKLYTEVQNRRIYNDMLVDSLTTGVIAADNERCITVFNREAQRITRLTADQALGHPIAVLPAPLLAVMENTYATGLKSTDRELTLQFPDGDDEQRAYVRVGSSVFHGYTGGNLGVLTIFHDVTDIKMLQEQVRRTDRLASMGTLSAGMAHEIKNPLVTIKTFTQLLPERYEDTDFRDTFVSLVGDEVKRIDGIVNQLLTFARPAAPRMTDMHVHDALDSSLRLVQQEFSRRNIELTRDYGSTTDLMLGDPDLLNQAFVNFFLNAHDAMEQGGQLRVTTRMVPFRRPPNPLAATNRSSASIRIDIADSGSGIKEADIARIFDPFFTTKSQGTGLGLTVSHGIIYEHGGVVDVDSRLGEGTTFRITFPLIDNPSGKEPIP